MVEVLKIDEWNFKNSGEQQFWFIDQSNESCVERIKDGAVFFVGDEVCYNNGLSVETNTAISKFDTSSMILVYMENGGVARINEIEWTEEFIEASNH